MKTAKEYIEAMQSDEAFAAQVKEKVEAAKDAGEEDIFAAVSKAAAELGYEISPDQIREIANAQAGEDISEEELGKVAGGTSCVMVAVATAVLAGGTAIASGALLASN